ncbi:MAG: hypothetical protein AB2L26_10520 [Ignavibacteria bacterium]
MRASFNGKSDNYLAIDQNPYKRSSSWIQPDQVDIYTLNYKTGKKELLAEGVQYGYGISPTGKYIHWFDNADSSWHVYSNEKETSVCVSKDITAKIYDELNDIPNIPDPYGIAGWTAGDNDLLIYDRFDIWKVSPVNEYAPVRLTKGREENTVYRYQSVNKDSLNISPDEKIF